MILLYILGPNSHDTGSFCRESTPPASNRLPPSASLQRHTSNQQSTASNQQSTASNHQSNRQNFSAQQHPNMNRAVSGFSQSNSATGPRASHQGSGHQVSSGNINQNCVRAEETMSLRLQQASQTQPTDRSRMIQLFDRTANQQGKVKHMFSLVYM